MSKMIVLNNVTKVFQRKGWIPFGRGGLPVNAVDSVSFQIEKGETVGLAGESGCGKTTLGRLIAGLYEPTGGEVIINGNKINIGSRDSRKLMRRDCRMIFQYLDAALNPYLTVGEIIEEPIRIHTGLKRQERTKRVRATLDMVNLSESFIKTYPHTLSGGEKRRVTIARAIAVPPKILIADEPVSALDVSIRAQIIDLFQTLQREFKLTMLFISHDMGVLNDVCGRLLVMYGGKIVEDAPIEKYRRKKLDHPYSRKLVESVLEIPGLNKNN